MNFTFGSLSTCICMHGLVKTHVLA